MNYKNRDDELIRKQKEGQAQTRANITVKQNATNNKVYSQAALQKLASGNYRKVPELKKTVSQNSAPKTTTPKQETKQQKPSTRYNQNISTQEKKSTRDTRYDNDFNEFHKYRVGDRIGVMDYDANSDREVEHWRNLKTEIMAKNKWTEKEFDDKWDAYYKERAQREANQEVGDAVKFAEKHPVLGTLLQGVYTPQAMIEGGASMLSALAPKEYKAQSADDTLFTGTRAKEGIKQAVKENNIKTGFGRGAYDLATSLGDMAFSAGIPVLGTAALGTQTAGRQNMQALERGVDPTKAALTGLGAGAISGVLNKVGLDKAVNTTAKTALGSVLKAAGIEGAENVTEDTANLLLDTVMNKDKSQLNAMHDYYKNQGMTDDEAWNRVTLGTLGDLGISALSGAAFGGVMNGASKIPELVGDIRAIIPEMNNRGAVDPKALAEEARLNVKGPAKVEMPKKYQGLISEDDYSYIFDERNNGIFNTINLVRQHAGNTPEAQQLAKDAKKSLRKYVEGGNVDDYYEFLGHVGDLSNLAENTKADYVTKGGRRYAYNDFFSENVDDDVNGGSRQENFFDYIDRSDIRNIVDKAHSGDTTSAPVVEAVTNEFGDRVLAPEEVSRLQDVVDGKYDIPENGNLSNSTKIPEYTMGEDVYFRGSDADIAQAEAQDQAIVDTFKNIIADPEFNALSFKNGSKEVYVSPATNGDGLRMSYTIDGVPTGHHDYSLDQLDDLSRNLRNEAGNGGEDIKIQRKSDMAKAPVPELSNGNEPPRRSFFDDLPRSDKEGKSKVGTNTAVNSNVYTRKQIDSDPIISELNKYAKANNDLTFNQAKEDIINEGSQILEDYTSGKRTISNDLDVDRAMILLTDMAQKISAGDKDLIPQRDLLFSKLRQAGTLHGQTIQAFKKWNNTAEGAIINGERIIEDTVKPWKTQNKKKVELNARIAKALEQMGVDSSMRNKPNTEKTHEQIKQGVKNVIEREFGSVENLFNDNDIEYLTSLAENKEIPVWVITDEIEHKMNHGEWYTIDESTPVKLETSSKLASILKNMGNDSLKEKNRLPDLGYGESHASIVQKIRNTLAQDPAAVDLDNPADVEVLANFIEEKIPNWQIEDEIHHRLMTGEWYTLDESIEPKKPINQRLKNALDDLVEKGPAPEKEPPTLDDIRNEVRATLDKEMARTGDFTDDDVNYLASLIQNGATKQELSEALNTKMATGKFGISPETQQQVTDLFDYANRFDPNSKQAFDLRTAAYKLLAEESVSDDATPFEKFESWRYLAMLGNPKTMVRNWIGNKMFGAVTGVSNNLSAALEAGTDRLSKALGGEGIQRTKTFLNPVDDRALIKAAGEDGEAHRYTELNGTKYEKGTKDAIKQQKSSFNSKLLRLYEAVTDRGISDYNAVKKKYSTSLAGYMKANGLDESAFDADDRYRALKDKSRTQLLTDAENAEMNNLKSTVDTLEKARDYAVKQAEYATFHEDNAVAKWLTKTSNSAPGPLRMVLEGLVPFKKTPANILRSGVEYSPLGAVKSIAETGKLIYENTGKRKGNLDDTYIKKSKLTGKEKEISKSLAADVLDSWSRTLTGTGLVGLGYYLKNKGILNSSNDDEKWQDDLEGKQNYSITINGKTYTLDWAAPAVMPLLMGAEMSKIKDRNGLLDQKWYENLSEVIGTANAILDPIFETSMMQGVKTTLEQAASDIKYNEDNAIGGIIGSMALNTGLGYLTQALPTLSGQVARTVDNTRRTTDTVSDGALGVLEKQGRKIMNKIPGLSMLNQPYYDSYGRTQNNGPFNNPLGNMAYQMLSPAYVRDINTTAADESARNAYYGLGEDGKPMMDAKVFPSWKSKVTVGGEKFTPEEMASYRKSSGEANYAIRDALTKEDWFNNLSGAEQSEILKKTNTLVDKIGKDSVDKLDSSSKEFEAYQAGGVEGLLNKWSGDIYSSKAKEETGLSGSTNAIKEINAAYAEGDTKKAEELTEKYTKYNKERERLNEKYGVNIKMADFTKREEANPGSNEAWAKEHSTGTTNNTTSTTTAPQVTTKDTSSTVDTKEYQKYIDRAGKQNRKFTNDIPKLKELNYSNSEMYTYAYAINQDSSLTPQTFNTQYKKLDLDGNGSMKQDEMITYFNNNNTSEQQANYLWRTYGENKGTPWKTLPVLRNGKWKKNK